MKGVVVLEEGEMCLGLTRLIAVLLLQDLAMEDIKEYSRTLTIQINWDLSGVPNIQTIKLKWKKLH